MATTRMAAVVHCVIIVLVTNLTVTLGDFSFSRESDVVILQAGQQTVVDMNITGVNTDLTIELECDNPRFFLVEGNVTFQVKAFQDGQPDLEKNHSISFVLKGVFIGITHLTFKVRPTVITNWIPTQELAIDPLVVKVRREPSVINDIFTYVLIIWLFVSYISMGVKMNWPDVWRRLRRPWGVIVGALCQFIVMPAIAFGLAKITNLDNVSAVGLVVIGCCPGGYTSNVITLILQCDLVLSITMTAVSTVLALGLMPLNLFLYGRQFAEDANLETPYENLFISLVLLVIPIFMGIFSYYKLPKVTKILRKVLRPLAICLILITLCFGIPVNLYAFDSPPEIYLVSIVFPMIGSTLGVLFAKMTCLDNKSAVTVGIETGYQNALIGLALAQLSYPQPEADLISRGPILFFLFSLIEGSVISGVYAIMNRFPGKPISDDHDESSEEIVNEETSKPSSAV